MAVISYHSLEDRIVKRFIARESRDCIEDPLPPVCTCGHRAQLRAVTKGVVTAGPRRGPAEPPRAQRKAARRREARLGTRAARGGSPDEQGTVTSPGQPASHVLGPAARSARASHSTRHARASTGSATRSPRSRSRRASTSRRPPPCTPPRRRRDARPDGVTIDDGSHRCAPGNGPWFLPGRGPTASAPAAAARSDGAVVAARRRVSRSGSTSDRSWSRSSWRPPSASST